MVGGVGWVPAHQVGSHVVGRTERRRQGVRPGRGQARDLVEGDERRPEHDRVTDIVDAAPAGPARELRVLPGREELVALAGELRELLDDDRARRHVDAERECLGGEDGLHEPGGEARLHRLLERRHHPGVVRGEPGLEAREPPAVPEDIEIGVGEDVDLGLGDFADAGSLVGRGEPHPRLETLTGGIVTRVAAEDEIDRGEHPLVVEPLDHLDPPRCLEAAARAPPPARRADGTSIEPRRLGIGAPVDEGLQQVGPVALAVADHVEVVQVHRSLLLDDRGRVATDGLDPVGELLRVRDRGRKAHEVDVRRGMDDHLFPHRAAVGILQVMDLVEHDVAQPSQRRRVRVDHVAQDLGGHHDNGRVAVDRVVAGEEPHAGGAVAPAEVAELLVRQRLEGCGVEGLAALVEGLGHRVLGDDGLPRACRRGHEHRSSRVEGVEGPDLERVELEAERREERVARCCSAHWFARLRLAHRLRSFPIRIEAS